jgi:hypothetical protein
MIQRVDRLRAVERDQPDAAIDAGQDLLGLLRHALASDRERIRVQRMLPKRRLSLDQQSRSLTVEPNPRVRVMFDRTTTAESVKKPEIPRKRQVRWEPGWNTDR